MDLTTRLLRDLTLLGDVLGPDDDLASGVERLGRAVRGAVPSFLGLSLRVRGATPWVLHADEHDAVGRLPRASLRLPVPARATRDLAPAVAEVLLVLRAGQPGAFVDLAADLSWLTGSGSGLSVLDADLTSPEAATGAGVHEASVIDQALGVLLGGGLLPAAAVAALDARAAATGSDRRAAADEVLRRLPPGPAEPRREP